jgi:enamine deaminase RidA (YjgF/YER057c/UK114 family)
MQIGNRRGYLKNFATALTAFAGARTLFGQTAPAEGGRAAGGRNAAGTNNRIHNGIYYFPGIGANSGYSREDHVTVTDPFEKHATRTMDSLKKSLERAGCTMDSILHLEVFVCLPHYDEVPMPSGKARFEAYSEHYRAFNKIYGTYFSAGRAPARAFMAVDWIPGDSLVEVVGSARVVGSPSTAG